jgi:hypothetical protein
MKGTRHATGRGAQSIPSRASGTIAVVLGCICVLVGAPAVAASPAASPPVVAAASPTVVPPASPGPADPPPTANPVCDPFLTSTEVSSVAGAPVTSDGVDFHDSRAPLQHIACSWRPAGGRQISLAVEDLLMGVSDKHFLIEKYGDNIGGTALAGLGDVAYSGAAYPGGYVAWAVTVGEVDRTLVLHSEGLTPDQLATLAHQVRSDATPGVAVPPSIGPVTPGSIDPAVVGDWILVDPNAPPDPPVSWHLDADGTAVVTIECKPPKGKKPPTFRSSYTTDGSTIRIAQGSIKGSCKNGDYQGFMSGFAFTLGMSTLPSGTWSVSGDILTIDGDKAPGKLILRRTAAL